MNPTSSDHDDWTATAVGYALSALEPHEQASFELHLTTCAQCRATVREVDELGAALAESSSIQPPTGLREKILAAAANTPQEIVRTDDNVRSKATDRSGEIGRGPDFQQSIPVDSLPRVAQFPGSRGRRYDRNQPEHNGKNRNWLNAGRLLVAAAVIALVGVLVGSLTLGRNSADNSAASQAISAAASASGPASVVTLHNASSGKAMVYVVLHSDQADVYSDDMPSTGSDSMYVLWGTDGTSGAAPIPIGWFSVDGKGGQPVHLSASSGGSGYSWYAISQEKGTTLPATPSSILAKSA